MLQKTFSEAKILPLTLKKFTKNSNCFEAFNCEYLSYTQSFFSSKIISPGVIIFNR